MFICNVVVPVYSILFTKYSFHTKHKTDEEDEYGCKNDNGCDKYIAGKDIFVIGIYSSKWVLSKVCKMHSIKYLHTT